MILPSLTNRSMSKDDFSAAFVNRMASALLSALMVSP
jgi:hypothetical protein